MNKKIISMAAAIAVGGTLIASSAFGVLAEASGYDTYKAAIKNLDTVKSLTAKADITINDNGSTVLNANSTLKYNKSNNTSSVLGEVKYGKEDIQTQVYNEVNEIVTKNSNDSVYYVRTRDSESLRSRYGSCISSKNAALEKGFEGIIDAYIGNRSSDFSVTRNSDGTENIAAKLDESQITPLDNAIVSFAVQAAERQGIRVSENQTVSDLRDVLLVLTSGIKVKSVDVSAVINKDNILQSEAASVTLTGRDAQRKTHSIKMSFKVSISNINSTAPDNIDLTGKKTIIINSGKSGRVHR